MRTEANAEGDAHDRLEFLGKNIGGTITTSGSSSVTDELVVVLLFSCAFFSFIASFEGGLLAVPAVPPLGLEIGDEGEADALIYWGAERGTTNGASVAKDRDGSVRLYNVWYDVVMAVVTEDPLAMGVRYSVCSGGR